VRIGVEAALVHGELVPGDVDIVDGQVGAVGLSGPGRGLAVPGFVDLQVNGFGGVDFLNASAVDYDRAGESLCQTGVTAYQPTMITAPEETLLAALREVPPTAFGPRIIGVHLEGPFLAPGRMGAHPLSARRDPDAALLERLLASGHVTEVTLAPELPGALDLIGLLAARGVVVSCGHSNATAEEAQEAFARWARTVTHVFNAMRPFGHRDPGIAIAALVDERIVVQIILDGHHMADETAALVWRAARGRVALVTDAIAAAGNGDGHFVLGAIAVEVIDGVARTPEGALAGSVGTMIEAVRQLVALGATVEEAVGAASEVPGRLTGRPGLGVLEPGGPADLVVLDDRLEIEKVMVAGDAHVLA
jgi:N-acetylglucosamine-6-phosphate deacetylase